MKKIQDKNIKYKSKTHQIQIFDKQFVFTHLTLILIIKIPYFKLNFIRSILF